MIDGLLPYSQYQKPATAWLGRIPAHWALRRGKALFTLRTEKSGEGHGLELLSVYTHIGVRPRSSLPQVGNKASSTDNYWVVRRGDIVFNKILAWMGAVGVSEYEGVTSPAYDVLRPRELVNSTFYHYLFRTTLCQEEFKLYSYGIMLMRLRLYFEQFSRILFPVPPPEEQAAIVKFLDHADRRIRKYIRAKQKLIKLLEEQKQAIIHQAVTRGLDPNVRLKPSGVEWLGDVPEHWEVVRIKSLSRVKRGASPRPIDDPRYFDANGEYAWVRIADVSASSHYLETTTQRLSELGASLSVKLEPGSVFLSIAGSVGKPIISSIFCCIHDGFVYFPDYRGNAEFLRYVFLCGSAFRGLGKLGTQLNLNTETVGGMRIPVPPVEEQAAIVGHLQRQTRDLELAIAKPVLEISLLREYRTRLIADVVTGKLDVREAAASLPDELEGDTLEVEVDDTEEALEDEASATEDSDE